MQLIFASNNQHKAEEINAALPQHFSIKTLKECGIDIDIPEPFATFEENAREKAQTIYQLTNTNCFSEDTGLEVEVLNGEPGVRSARYSGERSSSEDNINKLLKTLKKGLSRQAQFKTVICLIFNDKEYLFEGVCKGTITEDQTGSGGFGYDSIFKPHGSSKTFAQMTVAEKNEFSHRKKAVDKLVVFLTTLALNK